MTSTPDKVFADATAALNQTEAVLPARHRINPDAVAQPVEGSGYVYGQVGWLDEDGNTYGLRLPDNMDRMGVGLRPLYICLGRHTSPPDAHLPGVDRVPPHEVESGE